MGIETACLLHWQTYPSCSRFWAMLPQCNTRMSMHPFATADFERVCNDVALRLVRRYAVLLAAKWTLVHHWW